MKKIALLTILVLIFSISACQDKPQGEVIIKKDQESTEIKNTSQISSSYLPEGWIYEDNVYYSPKMYPYKNAGAYSLLIVPNTNFSFVEDYLEANSNCVVATKNISLNGQNTNSYIDKCMIDSPRVTLLEKDKILIKGISYSKTDESNEINKILEGIE